MGLSTLDYGGKSLCDLARDEVLASTRALVIEKNTVCCEHTVAFAVIPHNPVRIELRHTIGAARMKGGCFRLGNPLYLSKELARTRLVKTDTALVFLYADPLENIEGGEAIRLCSIVWHRKGMVHMALRRQIVDF